MIKNEYFWLTGEKDVEKYRKLIPLNLYVEYKQKPRLY